MTTTYLPPTAKRRPIPQVGASVVKPVATGPGADAHGNMVYGDSMGSGEPATPPAPRTGVLPVPRPTSGVPPTTVPTTVPTVGRRPPTLGTGILPIPVGRPTAPATAATQPQREAFKSLVMGAGGDFEKVGWDDIDKLGGQGYSRDAVANVIRGAGGYDKARWEDIDQAFGWAPGGPTTQPPPTTPPSTRPIEPLRPRTPITPVGSSFGPGNDMRFSVISPTASARQAGMSGMVDKAAGAVAGDDPGAAIRKNTADFTQQLETPDVAFSPVNTQVTRRGINPDVAFNGVNTDVARRGVDPNVAFDRVNTDVARRAVNPDVDFDRLNTDVTRRGVDPNVRFTGVDTDVDAGPEVAPQNSADLDLYRNQQRDAAAKLTSGPSRSELVQREMDAFDAAGAERVRDLQREVGRRSSALGRNGLGETEIEATKPFTDFLLEREIRKAELASRVAEGEVADRQNVLSATRGLVGDQYGQDAGTRGELRTERANVQDVTAGNLARRRDERNTRLSVDSDNKAREIGEADAAYGADVGNTLRRVSERDTGIGVAERNRARAMDESAADLAAETANVGRRVDERNTGLGVSERNVAREFEESAADLAARSADTSRRINERDAGLGVAERNRARAMDESAADVNVATGNAARAMDERNAGVANAQTNAARNAQARAAALSAGMGAADMTSASRRATLNSLMGLDEQIDARDRNDRAEQRGERQYQSETARQAIEDAIRTRLIENQEYNADFNQNLDLARYGSGFDTAPITGGAKRADGSAADAYEDMLRLLGRYSNRSV